MSAKGGGGGNPRPLKKGSIFPSQSDILLLQNHQFQAFFVKKTYYFIHEDIFFSSHMSVKA